MWRNTDGLRGVVKVYGGQPLEAVADLERAVRLDPLVGDLYRHFIGSAHLVAGQYAKAAEAFRMRIQMAPGTDLSRGMLIAALGHLGEIEEARRIRAELADINPNYSFAEHIGRLPFGNPADADRIRAGYAMTGLTD